ncbi:MAG: hypothetical protein PHQ86_00450 [Dehalococcoidales bacterium]|nr:hypothetical protein [Dehalococcoidales bacterium]
MTEISNELEKLAVIAADLGLSADLRTKAIQLIGNIGTHEALIALLALVANKDLAKEERDLAIQQAREIIKSGR